MTINTRSRTKRRKTVRLTKVQKRTRFVSLLNKLSQTTDDIIEEFSELKPAVKASLNLSNI